VILSVSPAVYLFAAILAGLILTLITGFLGIKLAFRVGLVDVPGTAPHKQHAFPMPIAGGIALMASFAVLFGVFGLWHFQELLWLFITSLIIFIMALLDDLLNLTPLVKFAGQLVAAILLIAAGTYVQIFETPTFFFGGSGTIYHLLNLLITILWIVGITNAFNLVDSMDGLVSGLSAWALAFFTLAAYDARQEQLAMFTALLLGICLTLYFFNVKPARFFLGDSGAQTLGFLLAVIAILYNPPERLQSSSWFMPILLLGVPIFDTVLVSVSRTRRGKHFYQANLDHTYHRLVHLGIDPTRAVLVMHMAALVLQCLAFIAISLQPFWSNVLFGMCVLAGAICLFFLDNRKCWS
jgi:UDP-GlcNAc:undecaprenyl-phosphate/decaprenyl-phosphate GlcNAc-1-phosphate transferase